MITPDTAPSPTRRLFPLVRRLSALATPPLVRSPLTPNQITVASIALGLGCAACLADGSHGAGVAGAALLVAAYVLDNCDGEVARIKGMTSRLGAILDTAGDSIVHAALFAALGIGVAARTGEPAWAWLGWIAAAGTAISAALALRRERGGADYDAHRVDRPEPRAGAADWALFVFRELLRADFCFVLLALALVDAAWLLLPAAAIGAQIYWATGLAKGAARFHV